MCSCVGLGWGGEKCLIALLIHCVLTDFHKMKVFYSTHISEHTRYVVGIGVCMYISFLYIYIYIHTLGVCTKI